jgi:hypothetical protein
MADVATQLVDGKTHVTTKLVEGVRYVSCLCCDTACCMYPAANYGADFLFADLPEELFYTSQSLTLQKISSGAIFNGLYQAQIEDVIYEIAHTESAWEVRVNDIPLPTSSYELIGSNPCLVDDFLLQASGIFDLFADSYSVTGDTSGTVTRSSLCVWSGGGLSLRYNDNTFKWQVNGNVKLGDQSSPIGSYDGGFSVS